MRHVDLRNKVRVHGRDFNNTIFRTEDITLYLNEAIDRVIQIMPQLSNIPYLDGDNDIVQVIPREYTHLVANYAAARLFAQDERHYEATTFMNEFELKLAEFKEKVDNGDIVLTDPDTGQELLPDTRTDTVVNVYYRTKGKNAYDYDEGVEGVE